MKRYLHSLLLVPGLLLIGVLFFVLFLTKAAVDVGSFNSNWGDGGYFIQSNKQESKFSKYLRNRFRENYKVSGLIDGANTALDDNLDLTVDYRGDGVIRAPFPRFLADQIKVFTILKKSGQHLELDSALSELPRFSNLKEFRVYASEFNATESLNYLYAYSELETLQIYGDLTVDPRSSLLAFISRESSLTGLNIPQFHLNKVELRELLSKDSWRSLSFNCETPLNEQGVKALVACKSLDTLGPPELEDLEGFFSEAIFPNVTVAYFHYHNFEGFEVDFLKTFPKLGYLEISGDSTIKIDQLEHLKAAKARLVIHISPNIIGSDTTRKTFIGTSVENFRVPGK